MNLSSDMKEKFVDEVYFVIEKMKNTDIPAQKLYYFSAVYAMARRIANFEYDPELIFIEQVLQLVYNMVNARLTAMLARQEAGIAIPDNLFRGLESALLELVQNVERGAETHSTLQKMVHLAYSTTGNGYYLYLKGVLKV